MHNLVMIGPQGSGKGTQSELLSLKLNIPQVTLGTLFRAEIGRKSDLGLEAQGYMDRGELVPGEVGSKIMLERLSKPDAMNGAILDGFPRTLDQADSLENISKTLSRPLTDVIYLRVSDDEAIRRLSGRRVCTNTGCEQNYHLQYNPPHKSPDHCDKCGSPIAQRTDDTPDAITKRLAIYHQETVPLIELYRGQGLLREVDGEKPIGEVQTQILTAMGV